VHIILNDLRDFAAVIFLAVGALLPIVDPLGGAPIYLAMTTGLEPPQRARMAKAVAINSFLLLIASALVGAYVLDFFGVSIPAVQIAGGLVVCAIGWSLLNSPNSSPTLTRSEPPTITADELGQRAFYPLTMPLTVGPGSISVALTLGANPTSGGASIIRDPRGARHRHPDRRGQRLSVLPLCRSDPGEIGADQNQRGGASVRVHSIVHRRPDQLERPACAANCNVPARYLLTSTPRLYGNARVTV
jgi:MarC family membrane protein